MNSISLYQKVGRKALAFGQGEGTLQGQFFRTQTAPQRDPFTVCGWLQVVDWPAPMGAFFGRDTGIGGQKEWSLFAAPGANGTLEVSLEVQLQGGLLSRGMGVNVPGMNEWHFVGLTRAGATWKLYVDELAPRTGNCTEEILDGSTISVGFVPGMFGGGCKTSVNLADWRVWEAALPADGIRAESASTTMSLAYKPWDKQPFEAAVTSDAGTRVIQDASGPEVFTKWGELTLWGV